jgi:Rrf2 family protein
VNISAKTEYACIAVLELAAGYGSGRPLRIREIAEPNGIPSRFLVQILLRLKAAGIVGSTRGSAGGYQLLKDPAAVCLAEVMAVVDGPVSEPVSSAALETPVSRTLLDAWRHVTQAERAMLTSVSFADLLELVRGRTEQMYYI